MSETEMALSHSPILKVDDLSLIIVSLLKGVVYQENDPRLWSELIKLQARVRDYVATLGLELIFDEAEGYAFLRSRIEDGESEANAAMPRLVARRPLSFQVSLLLALLRKKMAEFDARGGETRLILSGDEIVELIRIFVPSGSNDAKLVDQVDTNIKKIIDLGFLRQIKTTAGKQNLYEVRRILKAFIDAQWLSDFDNQLAQYKAKLSESGVEVNDE